MTDEANQLRCDKCGHIAYHQFRSTRERMMREHQTRKHKEKQNG